jgi:hypothetical protein
LLTKRFSIISGCFKSQHLPSSHNQFWGHGWCDIRSSSPETNRVSE